MPWRMAICQRFRTVFLRMSCADAWVSHHKRYMRSPWPRLISSNSVEGIAKPWHFSIRRALRVPSVRLWYSSCGKGKSFRKREIEQGKAKQSPLPARATSLLHFCLTGLVQGLQHVQGELYGRTRSVSSMKWVLCIQLTFPTTIVRNQDIKKSNIASTLQTKIRLRG